MKAPPIILLVLSVIIILIPSQCFNRKEQAVLTIIRPFSSFYASTPSTDLATAPAGQAGTQKPESLKPRDKMRLLEEKIVDLNNQIILLENENRALVGKLKTVSDFRESLPTALNIKIYYNLAVAEVIVKSDVSMWRRSILVNRGSNDGIQTGFTVVSGRYLVGRISEVGPYTSRVQLITDPAFRAQIVIAPPPAADSRPLTATDTTKQGSPKPVSASVSVPLQPSFGVLAGTSFNRSVVKWVTRESKVTAGWDVFSAPDPNALIPRGLIVGKVDAVSVDGFFYKLSITPTLDFYSVNSILILIPKTPK